MVLCASPNRNFDLVIIGMVLGARRRRVLRCRKRFQDQLDYQIFGQKGPACVSCAVDHGGEDFSSRRPNRQTTSNRDLVYRGRKEIGQVQLEQAGASPC